MIQGGIGNRALKIHENKGQPNINMLYLEGANNENERKQEIFMFNNYHDEYINNHIL